LERDSVVPCVVDNIIVHVNPEVDSGGCSSSEDMYLQPAQSI